MVLGYGSPRKLIQELQMATEVFKVGNSAVVQKFYDYPNNSDFTPQA